MTLNVSEKDLNRTQVIPKKTLEEVKKAIEEAAERERITEEARREIENNMPENT